MAGARGIVSRGRSSCDCAGAVTSPRKRLSREQLPTRRVLAPGPQSALPPAGRPTDVVQRARSSSSRTVTSTGAYRHPQFRRLPLAQPDKHSRQREHLQSLIAGGQIHDLAVANGTPSSSATFGQETLAGTSAGQDRRRVEHLRGVPWARIGELVGQRNLSVTANSPTRSSSHDAKPGARPRSVARSPAPPSRSRRRGNRSRPGPSLEEAR